MKIHFDEAADALYIRLDDSKIVESEEVRPGIVLDFNDQNQVVAIEILRVRDHVSLANRRFPPTQVCEPQGVNRGQECRGKTPILFHLTWSRQEAVGPLPRPLHQEPAG